MALLKFDKPTCGCCGTLTRPMYQQSSGGSKNTKYQHTRWRVCERRHKIYLKRG